MSIIIKCLENNQIYRILPTVSINILFAGVWLKIQDKTSTKFEVTCIKNAQKIWMIGHDHELHAKHLSKWQAYKDMCISRTTDDLYSPSLENFSFGIQTISSQHSAWFFHSTFWLLSDLPTVSHLTGQSIVKCLSFFLLTHLFYSLVVAVPGQLIEFRWTNFHNVV